MNNIKGNVMEIQALWKEQRGFNILSIGFGEDGGMIIGY